MTATAELQAESPPEFHADAGAPEATPANAPATSPSARASVTPLVALADSNKWDRYNQTLKFVMASGAVSGAFVLSGLGGPLGGPILCPLRLVTGVPCPLCGMTTSFTHMASGELTEALAASPGGPVLFIAAVIIALVTAVFLATRRRLSLRIPRLAYIPAALAVAGIWVYQIFHIGPLA